MSLAGGEDDERAIAEAQTAKGASRNPSLDAERRSGGSKGGGGGARGSDAKDEKHDEEEDEEAKHLARTRPLREDEKRVRRENMERTINKLPRPMKVRAQSVFRNFDKPKLNSGELVLALRELSMPVSERDADELLHMADALDGDDRVDLNEFLALVARLHHEFAADQRLVAAFQALDKDKDGFITKRDLERSHAAKHFSPDQLSELVSATDRDEDGRVSYKEFKEMLSGTPKG